MGEIAAVENKIELLWYGLYTRSHCEDVVCDQLRARGFTVFLPKYDKASRRAGVQNLIRVPIFPGYLFLRTAMDKGTFLKIRETRGLVRILGGRWDKLCPIPEEEIRAIQMVSEAHLKASRYPYLRDGDRVRITSGPLKDLEGIYLAQKRQKGLFIISVELFRQSVAVEIDYTRVTPL
ncbi:MAG: transcription antitermination protein [Parcubacteria group bacterium Gr01-1014_33]|nr:MAG: transcription antitermination protein [Parcubacteria group bacterium Gr01-1014_33]